MIEVIDKKDALDELLEANTAARLGFDEALDSSWKDESGRKPSEERRGLSILARWVELAKDCFNAVKDGDDVMRGEVGDRKEPGRGRVPDKGVSSPRSSADIA